MPHSVRTISSLVAQTADRQVRLEPTDPPPGGATAAAVDPVTAARDALAQPLDFPPLAQATVPGDHVAIAVGEDVPCVAEIVLGTIAACEAAGVARDDISVVAATPRFGRLLRARLENGNGDLRVVIHDPADPYDLCPVGMTERNGPLLINRTLYDADIVLPVGCARLDGRGVYGCLFPQFSGADAIRRYREPAQRQRYQAEGTGQQESDEAGWLVGVPLVIQVVPGRDGSVASVLAGEPTAVGRRADALCRQRWSFRAARRASLVVATVSGDARLQGWNDIGRAVAAAGAVVEDGGAVAVCCEFNSRPGKSLDRLMGCTDLEAAERKLLHDHAPDSWPAWHLAQALQRGPVYLLSHMDPDTVEEMGLAPIADLDELARLASRHESCIMLQDAQYTVVEVAGEGSA